MGASILYPSKDVALKQTPRHLGWVTSYERGTKTDDFDAKTRLAPTKGTKTDDFDAKTRLIFMIYLMYWI